MAAGYLQMMPTDSVKELDDCINGRRGPAPEALVDVARRLVP